MSTSTDAETMHNSMSRASNGGTKPNFALEKHWRAARRRFPFAMQGDVLDVDGQPVSSGWTLAVAAADLDGDMLPEIYFGNDFGPDRISAQSQSSGRTQVLRCCMVGEAGQRRRRRYLDTIRSKGWEPILAIQRRRTTRYLCQ